MKIAFLTYQSDKKGKCNLCNSTKLLTTLVLLHDVRQVYGDLVVCSDCRLVLEQALADSVSVEQAWCYEQGVS